MSTVVSAHWFGWSQVHAERVCRRNARVRELLEAQPPGGNIALGELERAIELTTEAVHVAHQFLKLFAELSVERAEVGLALCGTLEEAGQAPGAFYL